LDRRLDGSQSSSGRGGEEKSSQPLPGLEPPIIQPVAQLYTTELSRFLYPDNTRRKEQVIELLVMLRWKTIIIEYTMTQQLRPRQQVNKKKNK
jgi:hypothetical protein